jgi:MFS transporter, PPP family, 3-phenylpropionic acid transporter
MQIAQDPQMEKPTNLVEKPTNLVENTSSLAPRPKRLTPYLLGSLYYSIYWGVVGFFEPFINIYLQRLGISGFQIGLINSLLPLMALVYSPFISALADRHAWRSRILVICSIGLSVAYYVLGLPKMFLGIFVCSFIIAVLRSPTQPLGDALVLRLGSRHNIDYGRMRLWGSFFYAAVSILAGFVLERIGIHWMFPAMAVGYLLVTLIAFWMEEGDPVVKKTSFPWKLFLHNKTLLALYAAALLMGASTNIFQFSSMYMAHLGGGETMVGVLLGATAMCEVPVMLFGGGLMRRFGGMRTLLIGLGLFGIAYISGLFAWAPWMLVITGILNGGGFGLGFVSIVVTFDERAPDNWSAAVQALVSAGMFGFAPFIASIAYGAIYDLWPKGVYAFSAVLIGFAILALLTALRWDRKT